MLHDFPFAVNPFEDFEVDLRTSIHSTEVYKMATPLVVVHGVGGGGGGDRVTRPLSFFQTGFQ